MAFKRTRLDVPLQAGVAAPRPAKVTTPVSARTPYVSKRLGASKATTPAVAAPTPMMKPKVTSSADRQQGQKRSVGALGAFDSLAKGVGRSRTTKAKGGMGLGAALKTDYKAAKSSVGGAIRSASKGLTGGKKK